jgi:hypothetical protein
MAKHFRVYKVKTCNDFIMKHYSSLQFLRFKSQTNNCTLSLEIQKTEILLLNYFGNNILLSIDVIKCG